MVECALAWSMYNDLELVDGVPQFPRFNEQNVGQRYFLRTAFAFLASSGAFAFVATLVSIGTGRLASAYAQCLSMLICWIAAYHYYEIVKTREGQPTVGLEMRADSLRYGDWIVTMPLLTLKLYAVISRPASTYDSLFSNPEIAAVTSVIMVALGTFVRLGLDELSGWRRLSAISQIAGVTAWALSCVCLLLLLIDLGRAAEGHDDQALLHSFIFVWIGYPLVAFLSATWRYTDKADASYDGLLSIVKDVCFSCLDVYAKGVFAWYSGSAVFGVIFFAR